MKTVKKSIEPSFLAAARHAKGTVGVSLAKLTLAQAIVLGAALVSWGAQPAFALDEAAPPGTTARVTAATAASSDVSDQAGQVSFGNESASTDARQVADWVVDSGDNHGMPFAIIDKANAKVFVFHAGGRLRGAASALLGLAIGDDSMPGIGERKLSSIRPEERTTPAGRFEAALDRNLGGKEILWVDYDTAISLHPVITSNAGERRAQRLATPSPLDNRISYGCINVPADFFERVVTPAFKGTKGIVYVLPETRQVRQVFALYDVRERLQALSQPAPVQTAAQAARQ